MSQTNKMFIHLLALGYLISVYLLISYIVLSVRRTFQQTYTYLEKTATTKIIEDLAALAAELAM